MVRSAPVGNYKTTSDIRPGDKIYVVYVPNIYNISFFQLQVKEIFPDKIYTTIIGERLDATYHHQSIRVPNSFSAYENNADELMFMDIKLYQWYIKEELPGIIGNLMIKVAEENSKLGLIE